MWRPILGVSLCVAMAVAMVVAGLRPAPVKVPPAVPSVGKPDPRPVPERSPTPAPEPEPEPEPTGGPEPGPVPPPEPESGPEPLPAPEPEPPTAGPVPAAGGRAIYVAVTEAELSKFIQAAVEAHPEQEPFSALGFIYTNSRVICEPDGSAGKRLWLVPWDFFEQHLIAKNNDEDPDE